MPDHLREKKMSCPRCGGKGKVTCACCRGAGGHTCHICGQHVVCNACAGRGKHTCSGCRGKGSVRVRAPAPVFEKYDEPIA